MPAPTTLTRHVLSLTLALATIAIALAYARSRTALARLARLGGAWAAAVVPRFLSFTTFAAGAILLFSGATPPVGHRLYWLGDFLPLPIVELAHFSGSIAGIGLLILARGLQRRLDAAYHATLALLAVGVVTSILKGFDYEEALFLAALLMLLAPTRRYFYRRASIIEERFTRRWIVAIIGALAGSIVLGWLSYGGRIASGELFWEFELDRNAPRFMRATVGATIALVAFAVARLIRPARPRQIPPTPAQFQTALDIAASCRSAAAQLVVLGDKSLMFTPSGRTFVMYGVSGRSWVALGDPVGPESELDEAVTGFIDRAARAGAWPVFYKIGSEHLSTYLDFGLSVVKLGEEASVRLTDFSIEGPDRRTLRRVWKKMTSDGARFELVQGPAIEPLLPALRAVSDAWLARKATREKGFSLGRFDDDYVRRFPVGIVRVNDRVVAFANVWTSGEKAELAVDLMRFSDDAPPGVMRFLLTELMLWGRAEGWASFNLGMAPLAGLRRTLIAPMWYQVGQALYGRGERFYNFQGIRAFKEWFHPTWEPRYLANPGGALRPIVLANVAALVAGGYEGVVRR